MVTLPKNTKVLPHSQWRLGKVTKLIEGKKGGTRETQIRTNTKSGRPTTISKPVKKLFPLEVRHVDTVESAPEPDRQQKLKRTRREATVAGEQRRLLDQCYVDGDEE